MQTHSKQNISNQSYIRSMRLLVGNHRETLLEKNGSVLYEAVKEL